MIQTSVFGRTADGKNVLAFRIKDGANEAVILSMGGIIQSLRIADRHGYPVDVVLGYNDVASYEQNGGYLGALIGRCANRIDKGHMVIDGVDYDLYQNDNGNHLHGGKAGFDRRLWNYVFEGSDGNTLALTLHSPDGEESYPGNLNVQVRYSLVGGELKIEYQALSDKKTVINLTNHAYFNLDGEDSGDVLDTTLRINANKITPTDALLIPHGGFRDVTGTPFDFRTGRKIGERRSPRRRAKSPASPWKCTPTCPRCSCTPATASTRTASPATTARTQGSAWKRSSSPTPSTARRMRCTAILCTTRTGCTALPPHINSSANNADVCLKEYCVNMQIYRKTARSCAVFASSTPHGGYT